jgi:hypothetical protein
VERTVPVPPAPEPLAQERAFARAHPELAALAITQLREARAFALAAARDALDQVQRVAALEKWCRDHGVDELPVSAD